MAEMYKMIPSGFSFKKSPDGLNKVLPATIGKYFEELRGVGTDLYVIKHFYKTRGAIEIGRGFVPTGAIENAAELRQKQLELEAKLDEAKTEAVRYCNKPTKVYQAKVDEFALAFIPCQDGLIGCGWYDHADTSKKGLRMAASVLYALGLINAENDEVLWEVAYKYLPYEAELSDNADQILWDSLKEEVIKRNNAPIVIKKFGS